MKLVGTVVRSTLIAYLLLLANGEEKENRVQPLRELVGKPIIPLQEVEKKDFRGYILGGVAATRRLQWVASLQNRKDGTYQHWCGGSLIAKGWILTAAHCIDNFNTVCLGGLELTNDAGWFVNDFALEFHCSPVKKIYQHEKYDSLSISNDIMLVEFDSDYIGTPINLAPGGVNEQTGNPGMIVGWGKTETEDMSYIMKELKVEIYPNDDCSVWGGGIPEELPKTVLCTNTQDDSEGFCTVLRDSGGPLFVSVDGNEILLGVISFGPTTCKGLPMVYTRVSEYLDWIESTMANASPDLEDIVLPDECNSGRCKLVQNSITESGVIHEFNLTKGTILTNTFFLQADLQTDVSFSVEGIDRRLGVITGNPNHFNPLTAGTCFIPGSYKVFLDVGIWRTNKYDQYKLIVPNDISTLPECNPFPELNLMVELAAPQICTQNPGRCIELKGTFLKDWTLFMYDQTDYRHLNIWFQGPISYDINVLKGGNVALYETGLATEWVKIGGDCCAPGHYDISLEKTATAQFGGKYQIYIDNWSPNCVNDITTDAVAPMVSSEQVEDMINLHNIAEQINDIVEADKSESITPVLESGIANIPLILDKNSASSASFQSHMFLIFTCFSATMLTQFVG
eukprot:CFRG1948T1